MAVGDLARAQEGAGGGGEEEAGAVACSARLGRGRVGAGGEGAADIEAVFDESYVCV